MRAIVQSRFVARQSKFRRYRKWNLIRRAILERKKRRCRCTESIYGRVCFARKKRSTRSIDDRPHARPRIVSIVQVSRGYFEKRRTRTERSHAENQFLRVSLRPRVTSMEETKSPIEYDRRFAVRSASIERSFLPFFFSEY